MKKCILLATGEFTLDSVPNVGYTATSNPEAGKSDEKQVAAETADVGKVIAPEGDEEKLQQAMRKMCGYARHFRIRRIDDLIQTGNTFSVEFVTKDGTDKQCSKYYAYVGETSCRLLDDGEEVSVFGQNPLDQRRTMYRGCRSSTWRTLSAQLSQSESWCLLPSLLLKQEATQTPSAENSWH